LILNSVNCSDNPAKPSPIAAIPLVITSTSLSLVYLYFVPNLESTSSADKVILFPLITLTKLYLSPYFVGVILSNLYTESSCRSPSEV